VEVWWFVFCFGKWQVASKRRGGKEEVEVEVEEEEEEEGCNGCLEIVDTVG
jgi:hypothetical protein